MTSTHLVARRFLEPAALAQVGRLQLEARQPMQGSVAGKHRSPHRGSSVEFAEYRSYVPGDDLRRLDWRAYARSDRFYVKEFEADTNLRLCLVVDGSGSMRYGAQSAKRAKAPETDEAGVSKLEHASRMAALLAFLALRQGDAAGLVLASAEGNRTLPPKRKASQLGVIQDMLEVTEPTGETNLVEALHEVAERNAQRAMVVVLSDLFCEPGELNEAFQHLRFRKHDVVVFQLLERMELDFSFDRTTRFVDLEGGASLVVDPSVMARLYREALTRYRDELADVVRRANVDYHTAMLDELPQDTLTRFLLARARAKARR